jgi:TonB family protein
MMDRSRFDAHELPPDLAELDAELSSIRYEERPSFGPELQAELGRIWVEEGGRSAGTQGRHLLAAGVAGLLMIGLGAPTARASLTRWVQSLRQEPTVAPRPVPTPPPAGQSIPALELASPEPLVDLSPDPSSPGAPAVERRRTERWVGPEVTFPELADRRATEELIRRNYPVSLQEAGIGGVVGLRLWVDSTGSVEAADLGSSSGLPELDRVALDVARSFAFIPARRRGRAVGTPVEFDVRFEVKEAPDPGTTVIPKEPVGEMDLPELTGVTPAPEWRGPVVAPRPDSRSAGDLLRAAVADDAVLRRLGPIEAILMGDPPAGAAPTRWRTEVSEVLEEAMSRDPDNPAPMLALARIRRRQGLRTEARVLFERGLQKALRGGRTSSPAVLADLHYERGMQVRESWLAGRDAGRVSAEALHRDACPQARSSGGAASGYASAERLIAWNYLCPLELGRVFQTDFEVNPRGSDADHALMMASFEAAVEAFPAHVGANVEWLLALSDEGAWQEVLDGARRFLEASGGHPYGHLLAGIALQRLARSEEAEDHFETARKELPVVQARQLDEIAELLDPEDAEAYLALGGAEKAAWVSAFWQRLDPILSTSVNERAVEHMARGAYAILRFGSVDTDPGLVWVRYGRPDQVRVVSGGGGLRTEFWDFGPGPDVTFRGVASGSALSLTPEGRAYVDEIRQLLPHRYGNRSRRVYPLGAQVSRFRAQRPGATLVTVNVDRSSLPPKWGDREVDVVTFLLGGDGTLSRAERERRLVPGAPISAQVVAGPDASEVVVEVRDPRSGAVAALRQRAHLSSAEASPGISDLLLVRSSGPDPDDLRLDAEWVQPVSGPVDGETVGVLFEVYDVGRAASWYRLRAEIEDATTGRVQSIPVHPAGEADFRPTWDRQASPAGPTPEFLSLWVKDVPAGTYRLRVWADFPGAGTPLVSEQVLERG